MKKTVFLSHSSRDSAKALVVRDTLEGAGLPCWMAPRDVGLGDYGEAIIKGIEEAEIVVVLLSAAANESSHVRNEAERAASKDKTIITFRLEDVLPARRLELFLSSQQWMDGFVSPLPARAEELLQTLRLRFGGRPPEVPAPRNANRDAGGAVARFTKLLYARCWVCYDPTGYNPNPDCARRPDDASMGRDLERIRAAGFTGIVTSDSGRGLSSIPRIAKEQGLAVIAGVWNPAEEGAWSGAVELRDHIDAYCVGHNNLGKAYSRDLLIDTVNRLRSESQRPVTTSEEIRMYRHDENVRALGDWLFPDCHVSLRPRPGAAPAVDVERNVESCLSLAREIVGLAGKGSRPIMLKMVTFPWAGAAGASLDRQAEFFALFLEALRDPESGLPVRVAIAASSAFDIPWKQGHPFYSWDPYTGLLGDDGTPRPAVREIVSRVDLTA